MLFGFHVGFPGCTVDNSKQCVCSFFLNQLSRGHLWPDEFTDISCTGCMAQISNDFSSWLLWPLPTSKFNKWLWRIMIQFTSQCAQMKHLSLFYLDHPPDTIAISQLALSPKWAASCNSFAPIVAGDNCVTSGSMQRDFCADQTGQEQPWRIDVMIWPFPGTPQTKIYNRNKHGRLGSEDNSLIRVDLSQDLHVASVLMYTDSSGDIGWSGSRLRRLRLASHGSLSGGHKSIHTHPLFIFAENFTVMNQVSYEEFKIHILFQDTGINLRGNYPILPFSLAKNGLFCLFLAPETGRDGQL